MRSWFSYLKNGLSRQPPEDKVSAKRNLKNLYPFAARHFSKIIFGVAIVFLVSLLSYPSPLIQRFLVDNVIIGKKLGLLPLVIILLILIRVLEEIGNIAQSFYFARFERLVLLDIQEDLIDRVLRFPKSFFDEKETGYLMSRLTNDIAGIRWFFSLTIVQIASNIIRFIVGITLLFYLEWRIALVSIIVLPVLLWCISYFSQKMKVLGHHGMEYSAKVSKNLQEALASASLIKSFSTEKQETSKIIGKIKDSYGLSLESTAVNSLAGLGMSFLGELPKLAAFIIGVPLIINGHWTLGSLLAFTTYLSMVYGQARFLAHSNFSLQFALASLERISAFYDVLPEDNSEGLLLDHLKGGLEFRDVSFTYNGTDQILQNISFAIAPGEKIAIIGMSGAGKTTLISLMLGFYRPTKGEILFDGQTMNKYAISSLRKRIGYVSQKISLLSGTIIENLSYGNPNAREEEIIKAARVAGIDEFIESLPDKYNSLLGENGVNLSEGEKQRLSIARALVKDPDIIIMDEPSSSLDTVTERSILEALPKAVLEKTMIIAAHREATIKAADKVLKISSTGAAFE